MWKALVIAGCTGFLIHETAVAQLRDRPSGDVYKARIAPHWFDGNNRFWYRNELRGGVREFIVVDAVKGERKPAFDHDRLARALREAGVDDVQADRLELHGLEFDAAAGAISFRAGGKDWHCDLETYELASIDPSDRDADRDRFAIYPGDAPRASTRTGAETELRFVNETNGEVELFWLDNRGQRRSYGVLAPGAEKQQHTYAGHVWLAVDGGDAIAAFQAEEQPRNAVISSRPVPRRSRGGESRRRRSFDGDTSPDGRWRALVRDGNVFIRATEGEEEVQLGEDGSLDNSYQMLQWSPDSRTLVAFRVEPGEQKEVFLIESSPRGGGRAVLHQRPYALPGDKFASYEANLFQLLAAEDATDEDESESGSHWRMMKPDVERVDFGRPRVRWRRDGRAFTYTKVDRGHQRLRVIEVDARSGRSRNVIDEQTDTFIWTSHTENVGVEPVTWLEEKPMRSSTRRRLTAGGICT